MKKRRVLGALILLFTFPLSLLMFIISFTWKMGDTASEYLLNDTLYKRYKEEVERPAFLKKIMD